MVSHVVHCQSKHASQNKRMALQKISHVAVSTNNSTRDISKLSQISITYNNFEISLVVFMPNITTNHAITYTNFNN